MKKVPMYYRNHPEDGFDTAWEIRSIRGIRKLSLEDLSERTGISEAKLMQVEKNMAALTNSEIEKVAEALDTHPGLIAFPSWDHIAFKAVSCELTGWSQINGIEQHGKIKGYASHMGSLTLSFGDRKNLNLFTFGSTPSSDCPELKLEINGDSVGHISDVYESGPDFDGDSRNVTTVKIVTKIFSNGVLYNISGKAECKFKSQYPRSSDSPPGNWEFKISFLIEPEQIRDFFGIYQEPAERMIASMENLPKWSGSFDI